MIKEIDLFKNKKMLAFSDSKKRYTLINNIKSTESVDRFCKVLIGLMDSPTFNRKKKYTMTWKQKLDYIKNFCEQRVIYNETVRKISEEKLIEVANGR
jgi:hypothetical protein